ncbi:MAG: exosome complex RNA-binding protein Csl4 [Archaeoglobaceae archaeon]|nr:exosome complex RNA-binding protein Csl4 [Archaeoglobaceae archaeon]MDW8118107.1 exosome complex RNA-binding protein Csl4 [Archaeoglobaceae archaeon]
MIVLPGDKIGSVEEFKAGEGVYEEEGELFASVAGILELEDKKARIKSFSRIPELKKGDVVLGRVVEIKNSFAMVEIARKKGEDRELAHTGLALLHISNLGERVDNIGDAIGYFDILKARVLDTSPKISIREPEMGVIKAFCSSCKSELLLEGGKLKCPNCGKEEKRKISRAYGKGEW